MFQSEFGTFGVMICADRRWPETVRTLATRGARVIFNPTYGMHDERNLRMMQTRSYESEVYICFTHARESLITGPTGETESHLISNVDGCLIHDVDLAAVDKRRGDATSHLSSRRVDVYTT